jgi:hypothetical protein
MNVVKFMELTVIGTVSGVIRGGARWGAAPPSQTVALPFGKKISRPVAGNGTGSICDTNFIKVPGIAPHFINFWLRH